MLVKMFHGFCMALADSVPGVSGGTVAFILGFYEKFIDALHGLFGKDNGARKVAVLYLAKLGVYDRLYRVRRIPTYRRS